MRASRRGGNQGIDLCRSAFDGPAVPSSFNSKGGLIGSTSFPALRRKISPSGHRMDSGSPALWLLCFFLRSTTR